MTHDIKQRRCKDPVALNSWHAIASIDDVATGETLQTRLLEEDLFYTLDAEGNPYVWLSSADTQPGQFVDVSDLTDTLPAQVAYGYIWTCVGTPGKDIFGIPEFSEPDRKNLNAITVGINVSAPRTVENFLDMGHFPFVHTDILGEEPHTAVADYDVEISDERDEVLATGCTFYQPKAITNSTTGADVEYRYRVPHPYCAVLYKTNPVDMSRMDVIAVFVQPMDQEHVRAHLMLSLLDENSSLEQIRIFQQVILAQDKPILENQVPKRIPLDPAYETPVRADKTGIAYRRWLSQKGLTYGAIPAAV